MRRPHRPIPIEHLTAEIRKRVTDLIDYDNPVKGCFLWKGRTDWEGRGTVCLKLGADRARDYIAPRIVYAMTYGVDPGKLCVLHNCDEPKCVSWAHFFLGTDKDNSDDKLKKHRQYVPQGSKHPQATIDESQALAVKQALARGEPPRNISDRLGIAYETVRNIKRGLAWSHVQCVSCETISTPPSTAVVISPAFSPPSVTQTLLFA